MGKTTYQTHGVCSSEIHIEVDDNNVKSVYFVVGCNGNTNVKLRVLHSLHKL